MYIGHKRNDGRLQPLREHLEQVAKMASRFARPFHGDAHAYRTGLLHDAGKYSPAGQRRMQDPEHTAKTDHSSAGAQIAMKMYGDRISASAIAGHHGGMPDLGGRFSSEGEGTLMERCNKRLEGDMDYAPFWSEIDPKRNIDIPSWLNQNSFVAPFYTRMLFSCLVDADYLDTERFMLGESPLRGRNIDMRELQLRLKQFIQPWLDHPATQMDEKRCEILRDCMKAAANDRGLYSLTVPTGGGKTVASLAFAIEHAVKYGLSRIIYVIPYTSIIEQNARVFKKILGEDNVLEHHSGVDFDADRDAENEAEQALLLAAENWYAPVVVTTSVQFFESLFANKPSKCRKLHNIVNSIVIFDEAQMLPLPYLRPCMAAIAELVRHYSVTAVLCTATQPALDSLIHEYDSTLDITEICPGSSELHALFRRVSYERIGLLEEASLLTMLEASDQGLCVVNTRKSAQKLYDALPREGSFHLSTRMTPNHRTKALEEIRMRLKLGLTCRVVSTSLIEAGVDVDFPMVWREMAGLDSILQAGGRCNREGSRPPEESPVYIFSLPEGTPRSMQPNVAATEAAVENACYLDDAAVIRRYFDRLYWEKGGNILDAKEIMKLSSRAAFKSVAEAFHLIEADTRTIFIPCPENSDDLDRLRSGQVNRRLMRKLGKDAVNVYERDFDALRDSGKLEIVGKHFGILADTGLYDEKRGLTLDSDPGQAFII